MKYLLLNNHDVQTIDVSKEKVCCFCEKTFLKIFTVNTGEDKYNACELCKSIILYDKKETYKIILLISNKSQKSIVLDTINYFNNNGCIPSPHNIDENVKGIDMSSQNLRQIMSSDSKIFNKMQDKGIRAFITPDVNLDKIIVRNMFSKKLSSNNTFWDDVIKLKTKDVNDITKMKSPHNKKLEKSRTNLNNKINNLTGLLDMMSEYSENK